MTYALERTRVVRAIAAALYLAAIPALGCGDDDDDTVETGERDADGVAGTNGDGQNGDGQNGDGQNGDGAEADLTDSEIAGVMIAANGAEMALGNLALERAFDPRVRSFAEVMVEEHTVANFLIGRLVETTALEWESSELADELGDQAASTLEVLAPLIEEEFDLRYMQSQRAMHVRVLSLIDSTLLPSAVDPFLRTQLVAMRSRVSAHLADAGALLAELTSEAAMP
jgi:putative membrane protein